MAKSEKSNVFWVLCICQITEKDLFWIPGHWVVLDIEDHSCFMRISKYVAFTLKSVLDWAHKRLHTNSGIYPSSPVPTLDLVVTMAFGK